MRGVVGYIVKDSQHLLGYLGKHGWRGSARAAGTFEDRASADDAMKDMGLSGPTARVVTIVREEHRDLPPGWVVDGDHVVRTSDMRSVQVTERDFLLWTGLQIVAVPIAAAVAALRLAGYRTTKRRKAT